MGLSLWGKVTFEVLHPLSFEEFLIANNDKAVPLFEQFNSQTVIPEIVHEHLWEMLKQYFIVGGLPEMVSLYCSHKNHLFDAFHLIRKRQDDIINSYYADIAKHAGKINAMHIERVFRSVPAQISQIQDGSVGRFKFKGVVPGVTHYDRLRGRD